MTLELATKPTKWWQDEHPDIVDQKTSSPMLTSAIAIGHWQSTHQWRFCIMKKKAS